MDIYTCIAIFKSVFHSRSRCIILEEGEEERVRRGRNVSDKKGRLQKYIDRERRDFSLSLTESMLG